jgi:transcriptional regulator with XRE-family HTH domain
MVMVSRNKYPKNYIKELREERGWKLRDLEIKTGWSNQTLSNLELSKADLSWSKIQKLAEVFEVHPLEITEGPASAIEREILETVRGFADGEKRMFKHMLNTLSEDKKSPKVPEKPETTERKKS